MNDFESMEGYAWSGGGRSVVRVDVSIDEGKQWHTAQLIDDYTAPSLNRRWAWTRWQASVQPDPAAAAAGEREVWVRAVDSSYNSQPENMDHIWNLRGVMAVAYHKIKIFIQN